MARHRWPRVDYPLPSLLGNPGYKFWHFWHPTTPSKLFQMFWTLKLAAGKEAGDPLNFSCRWPSTPGTSKVMRRLDPSLHIWILFDWCYWVIDICNKKRRKGWQLRDMHWIEGMKWSFESTNSALASRNFKKAVWRFENMGERAYLAAKSTTISCLVNANISPKVDVDWYSKIT
jgi:hypothetical protein